MSIRLSGINPLAYMGVEPYTPPALVIQNAAPTVNDFQNFNVGTFWLIVNPQELWYLASVAGGVATWIQLYPAGGGGGATEFVCNVGTANEMGGILNVLGDGVSIQTTGSGNTVTIAVAGEVATSFQTDSGTATPVGGVLVVHGGSNINTSGAGQTVTVNLDNNVDIPGTLTLSALGAGVVQTDAGGLISSDNGTNGQLLIGGGTAPEWANLTSIGGTVIITNGANSINLEAVGGGGGGNTPVAFYAYQPTTYQVPIVSASPTSTYAPYLMGSAVVMSTRLNTGAGFFPGDGLGTPASFTAPTTGRYYFSFTTALGQGFNNGTANLVFDAYSVIITPTNTYVGYSARPTVSVQVASWFEAVAISNATVQLNAGDVVTFQVLGPKLTNTAMGNYCYTVVGSQSANVFPVGSTNYFPTSIEGFLLEAAETAGTVSFSAYNPANVTVPGLTVYQYGIGLPLTVEINSGGAFYPGDGVSLPAVFTAPVNGYYAFNLVSELQSLAGGGPTASLIASIVGPSNMYSRKHYDTQTGAAGSSFASSTVNALIALNSGQQVTFTASNNSAGNARITGPTVYNPAVTTSINNFMTGYLVSEF